MASSKGNGGGRSGGGGWLGWIILICIVGFAVLNPGMVGRIIGSIGKAAISAPAPDTAPKPTPQLTPNVDPNQLRAAVRQSDKETFADLGGRGTCHLSSGPVSLPVNFDLGPLGDMLGKPEMNVGNTTLEVVEACVQVNVGYDWKNQSASDFTLTTHEHDGITDIEVSMLQAPAVLDKYVSDPGQIKVEDTIVTPQPNDVQTITDAARQALLNQVQEIGMSFLQQQARESAVGPIQGRVRQRAAELYPNARIGTITVNIP